MLTSMLSLVAKHHTTLSLTAATVATVVLSKSWDVFFTKRFWPVVLGHGHGGAKLRCEEYGLHFLTMLLLSGCVLGMGFRFPGTQGKVVPALAAMLVGWSFKDLLTSCHNELEARFVDFLVLTFGRERLSEWKLVAFEWSDEGELNFEPLDFLFAIGCTVGAASLMHLGKALQSASSFSVLSSVTTLLSTSLGLGVAATWDMFLSEFHSIDDYALFVADSSCVPHDVPSALSLRVYWAFMVNTVCAAATLRMQTLKQEAKAKVEAALVAEQEANRRRAAVLLNAHARKLQRAWRGVQLKMRIRRLAANTAKAEREAELTRQAEEGQAGRKEARADCEAGMFEHMKEMGGKLRGDAGKIAKGFQDKMRTLPTPAKLPRFPWTPKPDPVVTTSPQPLCAPA